MCGYYLIRNILLLIRSAGVDLVELRIQYCGPSSSVGIATDYGLDGPGSNPSLQRTGKQEVCRCVL